MAVSSPAPARATGVEYARSGDFSLKMDYALPAGEGPFPAAILVHGGGWVAGDRSVNMQPLFDPLHRAGIAWFSISYRLATGVMDFGAAVEDVEAAVRYLKANAARYRIDPQRIALVGESAGGHLAALAALRGRLNGDVRAVVALYSPTDLLTLARTSTTVPQSIRNAVENSPYAEFVKTALRSLSPVENIHGDRPNPPFLLIHGTRDTLVPFQQSTAFCDKLKQSGGVCELLPIEGAGHGMRWWGTAREGYKGKIVEWLTRQFAAAGSGGRPASARVHP